jgi:hypothetical protein
MVLTQAISGWGRCGKVLTMHRFSMRRRGVALETDALTGLSARFGEQPEAVLAPLQEPRLDTSGTQPYARFADEQQQVVYAGAVVGLPPWPSQGPVAASSTVALDRPNSPSIWGNPSPGAWLRG